MVILKLLCVCVPRFGRKLAVIRGEVEREIQALVSKRDNVHTHHPYHAWDPVPSLLAASAGNTHYVSSVVWFVWIVIMLLILYT